MLKRIFRTPSSMRTSSFQMHGKRSSLIRLGQAPTAQRPTSKLAHAATEHFINDDLGITQGNAADDGYDGDTKRILAILLVEDDLVFRTMIEVSLRRQAEAAQIELHLRSHAHLAGALADQSAGVMPDVIITDLHLPDSEGAVTYRTLADWQRPLVVLTADRSEALALDAIATGATEYLQKTPDEIENLLRTVHRAIQRHRTQLGDLIATQQRARQQRILALGTMAAGIAHEFNNLHAIVRGTLEQLLRSGHHTETDRQRLNRCLAAISRADDITGSILDLSRDRESVAGSRCRLDEVVRTAVDFLGNDIAAITGALRLELTPGPVWVRGNQSQISQVLHNLCRNALHAMIDRPERILTIRVTVVGDVGQLIVSDTGAGISPDHLLRIFEPFFTTKSPVTGSSGSTSGGTGLGLSVSEAIVQRSGGRIQVTSRLHEGTTFTVTLPCAEPIAEPMAESSSQQDPTPVVASRIIEVRRVLVIEDEQVLRVMLCEIIAELGYSPVEARNGQEGLSQLISDHGWEAIILDWHMPILNGRELILRIGDALAHSRIPVLVVSGLSSQVEREMPPISGLSWKLIAKPFSLAAIESTLTQLIANAPR